MLHIDSRYAQLVAPRLEKFKTKSATLFNMKCPFCEAGTRDRKARGFIYERQGRLNFYCHKCGESMGMARFLKRVDSSLHLEYVRESLLESSTSFQIAMPAPAPVREFKPVGLEPMRGLDASHPAHAFMSSRGVPRDRVDELFFARDFFGWARSMHPDKYETRAVEPRVVIPFHGVDGSYVGFQGRALGSSLLKYVTIVNRPQLPYLYGLERVRRDDTVVALEGPIDAMFLDNAIASGGGDITRELDRANLSRDHVVIAYDNERRSSATVKKMLSAVKLGWRVCVWPESLVGKDVNDIVKSGMDAKRLRDVMIESSRSGAAALLAISGWKRCAVPY